MTNQILIQIPEVRKVRLLSKNYDQIEFEALVSEIQRNYLESLIGTALYLDLISNTTNLTSGLLTIGEKYKITNYKTGDNFLSVGATSNENNISFIATGTTPAVWTNESVLQNTNSIYYDLLEGKQYTYQNSTYNYYGAKYYIIYMFLYLYFKEGDINYTDSGTKNYNAENSSNSNNVLNRSILDNHFNSAKKYGEEIITFLNNNSLTYPLYNNSLINEDVNYRFDFKVIGTNYNRSKIIT